MKMILKVTIGVLVFLFSGCSQNIDIYPNKSNLNLKNKKDNSYTLMLNKEGHNNIIRDIIVTKDKYLITASDDKTIKVFDYNQKKMLKRFDGQISRSLGVNYAIALDSSEKYLASAGRFPSANKDIKQHFAIRIFNFKTKKLVKLLENHTDTVSDLTFTNDGKYLISSSYDQSISIWDMKTLKLYKHIKFNKQYISSVKVIKKNNDYLIITSDTNSNISIYSLKEDKIITNKNIAQKFINMSINENLIILIVKKKIIFLDYKLNQIKEMKNRLGFSNINISQDGRSILAQQNNLKSKNLIVINSRDFKVTKTIKLNQVVQHLGFIDNQIIYYTKYDHSLTIFDISQNKEIFKLKNDSFNYTTVGTYNDKIGFSDLKDLREVNNKGTITKAFTLSDMKFFDIKNDNKFNRMNTNNPPLGLLVSNKDKKINKTNNEMLSVIDYKNSKILSQIIRDHISYGWYNDIIISGGFNGYLEAYNNKGKKISSFIGHIGSVDSITILDNILISVGNDNIIKLWDLRKINTHKIIKPIANIYITKKILGKEKILNKWLISSIKKQFKDANLSQKDIIKIIKNSKEMSKLLYTRVDKTKVADWIIWTKEGFFDASKNGAKYIGYHINQGVNKEAEFVTVDALYKTFYRPDLIQKALKGEDLSKYAKNINIEKLLQDGLAPEVNILTKTTNTKTQDMDLKVQVCPKNKGGYDNLTLLINDTPVSVIDTSRALKIKKKSKRDDCFIYNQTITLLGGKNTIGFKATNKAGNIESKPDFLEVTFDDTNLKNKLRQKLSKISGNQNINDLHILAIAVNEYKDNELKLNYSINDATQMLKTIQTVSKPLFNKVHTYKLFDKDVTKQNIKDIFKTIKSTREDVFLLYIAGHGITDEYNGNYYYIPYDFISKNDKKAVQTQGVGQRDLMLGLSKITALKSLVLLDTCNSGSFVEANMQKTTTNRLAKATGRATISASSKSQVALEGYKGHGVFTYTLLEALKGKGYKNDSRITTNELSDYVEDTLPNRTYEKWGYKQLPQKSMFGVDFNIGEK